MAFYNPEPLAEFIDVSFTGEAEDMLRAFLSAYRGHQGKTELLGTSFESRGYVCSQVLFR